MSFHLSIHPLPEGFYDSSFSHWFQAHPFAYGLCKPASVELNNGESTVFFQVKGII